MTDQTGGLKLDDGKLDYSLVDAEAEKEFVAVLTYGAVKYEPGNWAHVKDAERRYYSALRRHLEDDLHVGYVVDDETGLLHLAHAACCVHFLLALRLASRPDLVASRPERLGRALVTARKIRAEREGKEIGWREKARARVTALDREIADAGDRHDGERVDDLGEERDRLAWLLESAERLGLPG